MRIGPLVVLYCVCASVTAAYLVAEHAPVFYVAFVRASATAVAPPPLARTRHPTPAWHSARAGTRPCARPPTAGWPASRPAGLNTSRVTPII